MNTAGPLRVLYCQFLFRLMDVELLSSSAGGDSTELLGQFASLLVFGSLLLSMAAWVLAPAFREPGMSAAVWATERFLISVNMLVVGAFALLNWDSTFLDRSDVLVLGPLPIPGRTLVAAKTAAAASALALTVAAWNSFAGFAWPLTLAPPGSGILGTLRFIAAFWIALLASGAFLYCALLSVQALLSQLPRSWYLRVSPLIQAAAFVLFLGVLFFQPSMNTTATLAAPRSQGGLDWLPTYWFLGLLSELSGAFPAESHLVLAPLARRSLIGLAAALLVSGSVFVLSYLRALRKIVEEPDLAPPPGWQPRLPQPGFSPRIAISQFAVRTLLRSRSHRTILAFYFGGGLAVAVVYLNGARSLLHLTWLDLVHVNFPVLTATVVLMCASWLGVRSVFPLPLDIRANWMFRVIPLPEPPVCHVAVRRALWTLAVMPVLAASSALLISLWPWALALKHELVLALLGSILVDASLFGFRKIPFACAYLPGKSKVHLLFWFGVIPLVVIIHKCSRAELDAIQNAPGYWIAVAVLAAFALAARKAGEALAKREDREIEFEDRSPDALIGLDLNR